MRERLRLPPELSPREQVGSSPWLRAAFLGTAAFTLSPWASPALALALGAAFGIGLGNPFGRQTARTSKMLLQACVVGLGFGMPLSAVIRAGSTGLVYTVAGIATALGLGLLLGRWLRVEREVSWLITTGTSICGGSAIAAVGPAIGARGESMSVSLATVFVLNAVALYLFPPIGHLVGLSQEQFAVWAAVAIHDTSSVVGAASAYGARALESATVLKLARALWIVPLTVAAAAYVRRSRSGVNATERASRTGVQIPWFVALFVAAAAMRTFLPAAAAPAMDVVAYLARIGLVLVLFLIGAGLTRATLRAVGTRPLLQGVLLWLAVASLSLTAVWYWLPA